MNTPLPQSPQYAFRHLFHSRALCCVARFVALALVAFARVPTAHAGPDTADFYGMNDAPHQYADANAMIDQMAASGVKWLRFTNNWSSLEIADNDYGNPTTGNFAKLKALVARCNLRGINVVFVLYGTPQWASMRADLGYPGCNHYRPTNWAKWDEHVTHMVTNFNGAGGNPLIKHWEVWNEEDYAGLWLNPVNDQLDATAVADFRELMTRAAPIIRSVAGNKVLMGGLALATTGSWGLGTFFDQLLDGSPATAAAFDIVNFHSYGHSSLLLSKYNGMMAVINKPAYSTYGLTTKKIWLTEVGYTTVGINDNEQSELKKANYANEAYMLYQSLKVSNPNIERIFWYNYRNSIAPCSASFANFGLTTSSLVPLDALYSYQAAGQKAPPPAFVGPNPSGEGAVSEFVLQNTFPAETQFTLTLYGIYVAGWVSDYNVGGSQKVIAANGYFPFKVADDWIYDGNGGLDSTVYADVTYLDVGTGNFGFQYESTSGVYTALLKARTNTGNWLTHTFTLTNVKFANGQDYGADFRIHAGGTTLPVSRVALRRIYNPGGVVLENTDLSKLVERRGTTNPHAPNYNPTAFVGGLTCRQILSANRYIPFRVSDGLARAGNNNVTIGVTFYDNGGDPIILKYNAITAGTPDPYKSVSISKLGGNVWRTVSIPLTDAHFINSQIFDADFRLTTNSPSVQVQYIRMVTVEVLSPKNF